MTQKTLSLRAWSELLLLALIWGASFLSTALILREVDYLSAVALRLFGAMVALWAVVLIRRVPVPRSPRIWAAFAVMAGGGAGAGPGPAGAGGRGRPGWGGRARRWARHWRAWRNRRKRRHSAGNCLRIK